MNDRESGAVTGRVTLREVSEVDLRTLYEQQLDPTANRMAAFTVEDPTDLEAFMGRWAVMLGDDAIIKRTILFNGKVVGHVACFERDGKPEVTYWIGKEYWGQGLASRGLAALLRQVTMRPIYARVAKDNVASIRVLEKCGFAVTGEDKGFAHGRGEEVEEFIMTLGAT